MVGPCENEASETTLHLPALALDALKHLPQGSPVTHIRNALAFARKVGSPLRSDGLTSWFTKLLAACNVREGIAVHDFGRHRCASLMATKDPLTGKPGATMKQVQVHLRHTSIAVTMDLYTHLFPEDQKDAAAQLDQLLSHGLSHAGATTNSVRYPDLQRDVAQLG